MGARNYRAVREQWAHLVGDQARLVLLDMAWLALDPDPRHVDRHGRPDRPSPPVYDRGHARLAVILGRPKFTPADARAVRRAIDGLVRAGAITPIGHTAPHIHATYRINITT